MSDDTLEQQSYDAAEHQKIQEWAYQNWQWRGSPIGSPEVDWFLAEESVPRAAFAVGEVNRARRIYLQSREKDGASPMSLVRQFGDMLDKGFPMLLLTGSVARAEKAFESIIGDRGPIAQQSLFPGGGRALVRSADLHRTPGEDVRALHPVQCAAA